MKAPVRTNPLLEAMGLHGPAAWTHRADMQTVERFNEGDAQRACVLGVLDVSWLRRAGCKGPQAAAWLAQLGLPVPPIPNSWLPMPPGGLVARLGRSEFLIEDAPDGRTCARIEAEPCAPGVYPVLHQDASLLLQGRRLHDLLLQTCSLNFAELDPAQRPVVLTSMAGVAITALPFAAAGVPSVRLWCDGTYGAYLWQTLVSIAEELGGGPVGSRFEA